MENLPVSTTVAILGFILGAVFGATAQRTNFCTMGSISDMVLMENKNRFRAWLLTIAIAVLGSQVLFIFGKVDLTKSIYLTTNLGWAGAIIGGILFGFGMVLAGGCGSKTLVRLGAGNLKSLVVALFLGVFAYMTLRGLVGIARLELEGVANIELKSATLQSQGIPDIISSLTGLALPGVRWAVMALFVLGLLWFCFKDQEFRQSPRDISAGLIIGSLVPIGWYITGVIGHDDFEPTRLASLTFVAPVGEGIQYLMTFTGSTINFGIATVGGVITGAFVMAKSRGEFRLESFVDVPDMVRHMFGGAIMGIGGVMALGCTIGQGITGMSTLAIGSLIAFVSIIGGGILGMKYFEEGSLIGAIKALCGDRQL
ncbi:MAG: YeeE/YedE family protein [Rhodospirillales bacterium]|jgi:uncharacterized membrane protein YedE/YeeE